MLKTKSKRLRKSNQRRAARTQYSEHSLAGPHLFAAHKCKFSDYFPIIFRLGVVRQVREV